MRLKFNHTGVGTFFKLCIIIEANFGFLIIAKIFLKFKYGELKT